MLASAIDTGPSILRRSASPPLSLLASRHPRRRYAATAMEYLFVVSLIIVVAIIGINYLGQQTKATLDNSNSTIQNATNGNNSTVP